jgi:hypothetical protein
MRRRLVLLLWIAAIAVAAILIAPVMTMIPTNVRGSLAVIVLPSAALYFLYSWWRWHRKQAGDVNELEWLDELAREHEAGTHDHSERLKWLVLTIEKNHKPSHALADRLANVRRILDKPG